VLLEYAEPGKNLATAVENFVFVQTQRRAVTKARKTKLWLEQMDAENKVVGNGPAADAPLVQPKLWLE